MQSVQGSLHEDLVSTLMYGYKTQVCIGQMKLKIIVVEMDNLQYSLHQQDRQTKEQCAKDVRCEVIRKANRLFFFRWYGQVECTVDDRLVKSICSSMVKGTRRRGRLQKRWIDSVRESIRARDISCKDARGIVQDQMQLKHFVYRGHVNGDVGLTCPTNLVSKV